MIKWTLQDVLAKALDIKIAVALDVAGPEEQAGYIVEAEGDNDGEGLAIQLVQDVRDRLKNATALRGHTLQATPTAGELQSALRSKELLDYEVTLTVQSFSPLSIPTADDLETAEALGLRT